VITLVLVMRLSRSARDSFRGCAKRFVCLYLPQIDDVFVLFFNWEVMEERECLSGVESRRRSSSTSLKSSFKNF